MFLLTLGPNHPKCQSFIKAEDRKVQRYNDGARRLNEKAGQHLMSYKRNRYTNSMPLSPSKKDMEGQTKIGFKNAISKGKKVN
jgi:hypothetical protein